LCQWLRLLSLSPQKQTHRPEKLSQEDIVREVTALQDMGHKRLVIESGEDPVNNPIEYILECIQTIYSIKHKNGDIRRVNFNIAATTVENYRELKAAGIGTYILFQETYHKESYEKLHTFSTMALMMTSLPNSSPASAFRSLTRG
jgi:2-iminoacetate synthase ThiH